MQSTVLTVGRLVPRKGQKYLIEAVKRLVAEGMDLKLVIIGIGPEEENLKIQAENLNFRLELIITDKQLEQEYKSADIFVLPSITDKQGEKEGLGLVLLEAIHFKLPVIAFENGGTTEIVIDDYSGVLLPEKDVDGLTAAIRKILTDQEYRDRLIETAYKDAHERFSVETIINQQLEIYDEILDKAEAG
ncbi:MAG: glycosyltransferase family 4 protein [candidate division Zixibacteria bacterium]|nr:glycosyltransferase family 4 protein [candidate division Zixibacteria bacterium]